jgi:hypothetical protein
MAQQKVSETGEPEKIEVKDTVAAFPETPVIICDACGKGFLRWSGDGVDIEPVWFLLSSGMNGGTCGGALVMISRHTAIEIADRFEQIGAEAWLKGQRRP